MSILKKIIKNVRKGVASFFKATGNTISKIYKNRKSAIGFTIMMFFILVAIFGPVVFPYDSTADYLNRYQGSSWEHLFGTDYLGRDVLAMLINGSRNVLTIAFLTGVFTVVIGVVIGMVSGLVGGFVDRVFTVIINLFLTVPSFPIIMVLAAVMTIENSVVFALVLSIWSWAGLARAIRAQVVSLKERDFIQICRVMDLSRSHIIFKELIPNIASYIAVNFIMIMRGAITGSVGIMLLGLASFEPTNWGAMLNLAIANNALLVRDAFMSLFVPIFAIVVFQVGVILLANGMDEILNPRLRVS